MDAQPPQIVFEQPAPCSDVERAEDVLVHSLASSRAPKGTWTVTLRIRAEPGKPSSAPICVPCALPDPSRCHCDPPDPDVLNAEGEITDESGGSVAKRTFRRPARECASLARAVGVWASLVLDAELERLADAERAKRRKKAKHTASAPVDTKPDTSTFSVWPPPVRNEPPSPEQFAFLRHPEKERSLELGAAAFVMHGTGTSSPVAGPAIHVVLEALSGLFVGVNLAVGRTFEPLRPSGGIYGTWASSRVDACARMPGFYIQGRGLQLDLCGGADLGFLVLDQPYEQAPRGDAPRGRDPRTIPYFALGPALGIRGDIGGDLSVLLRGITGLNVIRERFSDGAGTRVDTPGFIARGELGLIWRMR